MPTYHARGISVRLGTMPLDKTTTRHVVLRKGEVAKQQCEDAEKQLRGSRKLDEQRVPLLGDATGFDLHWLQDVPFMQVQVENDCDTTVFRQPSAKDEDIHMEDAPSTTSIPQALILHVGLSNKTFVSGFESKTHLKVDILFNGQLSGCSLIHTNDIRSGAKSLDQVFAGSRVDYLAERPWVILPPGSMLDGKLRGMRGPISAEERWAQVNQSLLNEAVERGINRQSDSPSTAKLLVSLAKMQMPEQLKYSQDPGKKTFGIIDVIITAGTGKKVTSGTRYLNRPERLRDACFSLAAEHIDEQTQPEEAAGEQNINARGPLDPYQTPPGTQQDADCVDDSDRSNQPPPKRQTLSSTRGSKDRPQTVPLLSSSSVDCGVPSTLPSVLCTPQMRPPWTTPKYSEPETWTSPSQVDTPSSQPLFPINAHNGPVSRFEIKPSRSGFGERLDYSAPVYPTLAYAPHVLNTWHSDPMAESCQYTGHMFPEQSSGIRSISSPMSQALKPTHVPFAQMPSYNRPSLLDTSSDLLKTSSFMPPGSLNYVDEENRHSLKGSVRSDFASNMLGISSPYKYGAPIASGSDTNTSPMSFPHFSAHAPILYGMPGLSPLARRSTYPTLVGDWNVNRLPPRGFFTVPQKPRRIVSPSNSKSEKHQPSIQVSRLVVTGKNGTTVLDHQWAVPQHVLPCDPAKNMGKTCPAVIERMDSEDDSTPGENCNICPLHEEVITQLLLSDAPADHDMQIDDNCEVEPTRRHSAPTLPYLRRHHGGLGELPAREESTKACKDSSLVAASEQSKALPRFKINRTGITRIQKPKMTTEVLDEPESCSNQAARPYDPISSPSPSMKPVYLTPPVVDTRASESSPAIPSSPLSSAPPSPTPCFLPQLDGPPEPKRTLSSARPQTRQQSLPTSAPLIPPSSRKRKPSLLLSPAKRPRVTKIPDTLDNPPLNRDCVIAFAEGRDAVTGQGVLRQVRGERQGVFREEYVVLAVRFYVTGG
jgi:hypothetical protein